MLGEAGSKLWLWMVWHPSALPLQSLMFYFTFSLCFGRELDPPCPLHSVPFQQRPVGFSLELSPQEGHQTHPECQCAVFITWQWHAWHVLQLTFTLISCISEGSFI